jgi:hypothetical protein
MRAETAQEARDFVSAGRKNLIINGDMRIAQRGTSSTIDNNYSTVDRWFKYSSGDTNTWGQAVDPVHGYYAYWKANSSGYGNLRQRIEGFHIPTQGITVTLSFWMKIDSGQAPLRIEVWNLTDNNNILSDTNIDTLTSSWKYYTITFNILSNVSLDTFHIMIGSNSAPAGTTFYLTKVQLEVGKNATEFEHRSYGEELALCQRYFESIGGDSIYERICVGMIQSTGTNTRTPIFFKVKKRANPTVSISSPSHLLIQDGQGTVVPSSVSFGDYSTYSSAMNLNITSSRTAGQGVMVSANNTTSLKINVDSEL